MIEIKNQKELDDVIRENPNELVVVKFSADWCGPCKVLGKTIKEVEGDYPNVKFVEVNIEEADEDLVNNAGIRNIPVLQYLRNGEVAEKTVGSINKNELKNNIDKLIQG